MIPNRLQLLALFIVGACGSAAATYFLKTPPTKEAELSNSQSVEQQLQPPTFTERSQAQPAVSNIPDLTASTFRERFAIANAFESDKRRAYEIERIFESMTREDAPAILEIIMSDSLYHAPYGSVGPFFARWAALDPTAAFAGYETLAGNPANDALKYLMPVWAKSSPNEAWQKTLEIFQSPKPPRPTTDWVVSVLKNKVQSDPSAMFSFAMENPAHPLARSMNYTLASVARDSGNLPAYAAQVVTIEDPKQRQEWLKALYMNWASSDSDAALTHLKSLPDTADSHSAMVGYLTGWSRTDPSAALDFAIANPENEAALESFSSIFSMSVNQSSTTEEKRLVVDRIIDTGLVDTHGQRISGFLSFSDPDLVMYLADHYTDPRQRERLQTITMRTWARNDYEAAKIYYETLSSPEDQSKLRPLLASQLYQQNNGGSQLAELWQSTPDKQERLALVENLLIESERNSARASKDYLEGLELISAEYQDELSEKAAAQRDKLYGKKE